MRLASLLPSILQFGLLPGLVLVVSVACTLIGYEYAKYQEHYRITNAFNDLARLKAQRVYLRVDGYERSLMDLRGLFIADEAVTEAEFKRYLDGVAVSQRYPALLRIGYAPLLTDANRAFIEAQLRSRWRRDYQAPATRTPYFPVLYGYPTAGTALGSDLNADPVRGEALDAARDRNQPQITRQVTLRYDGNHKPGFNLYVPVYGSDLAPATLQQRRQALTGYLYAAFRIEDLISSTIGPDLDGLMRLALFDGEATDPGKLAYDSDDAFQTASGKDRQISSVQHLQVAGRPWTFLFVAKPQFIAAHQSRLPMSMLIGGLLASALAAWLVNAMAKRFLAEKKIRHLAFHDELTDLPNRAMD
jgi:CHASE1-domain containing sensor protein